MQRFRIGTRGSLLALAQAHETMTRIAAAEGWSAESAAERLELVIIRSTGDRITDRPLAEAGGKGLFVEELDVALADDRADLAVHSRKNLQIVLFRGNVQTRLDKLARGAHLLT